MSWKLLAVITLVAISAAFLYLKQNVDAAEARRKQDATAFFVRDALMIYYAREHAWPNSLKDLQIEENDANVSTFRIVVSSSQASSDSVSQVIAEADSIGWENVKIRIYSTGDVRWE